jgi:hypothetical protein
VAFTVVACNQLLGIEDANVDARLSAAGRATAAMAGTSSLGGTSGGTVGVENGGSGGTSGSAGHEETKPTSGTGGGTDESVGGGAGAEPVGPSKGGSTSKGGSGGTTSKGGSAGKPSNDGNAGEAGDSSGMPADPCDEYCDEMEADCTGDAAQYRDRAQCMTICHFFPVGDASQSDENSSECRLKYVRKARYGLGAEVTDYCRQAGPSGEGKCGSACDAFCSVMMQVCTEESSPDWHFASESDCLTTCGALPAASVPYSANDPAVSDGNHALCRLFHANSAAMADTDEHCEHAMGHTMCQAP